MRMAATDAVEPVDFVPKRAVPVLPAEAPAPKPARPRWARCAFAGVSATGSTGRFVRPALRRRWPRNILPALATEIDVGGIAPDGDRFDLVLGSGGARCFTPGSTGSAIRICSWSRGRRPATPSGSTPPPSIVRRLRPGATWPVAGRITSSFGYRYHPILRFSRFHAGVDFGASWGSPIVAAADGQVVRAGWAGGYGRQVRLAHGGGLITSYSHMSEIVAEPGSFVRAGQLIGYVGSSGLSTGPHLHYEVLRNGTPVNPLSVRFTSVQVADAGVVSAVKARLKALLSVGVKRA